MQTLLIDTDPGVDDALALLMAHAHPGTRVAAITTTAGNVGLAHTTRNARKLLSLIGANTPVFPGCESPLVRPAADAAFVHGMAGDLSAAEKGQAGLVAGDVIEQLPAALLGLARLRAGTPGHSASVPRTKDRAAVP